MIIRGESIPSSPELAKPFSTETAERMMLGAIYLASSFNLDFFICVGIKVFYVAAAEMRFFPDFRHYPNGTPSMRIPKKLLNFSGLSAFRQAQIWP